MAGSDDEIAAERVDFACRLADIELFADGGADVIEAGAAVGHERAVALRRDRRQLVLVVFVGDVADDKLDQIFHGDSPSVPPYSSMTSAR